MTVVYPYPHASTAVQLVAPVALAAVRPVVLAPVVVLILIVPVHLQLVLVARTDALFDACHGLCPLQEIMNCPQVGPPASPTDLLRGAGMVGAVDVQKARGWVS